MNQDQKKKVVKKIIATTTLSACLFTSTLSLTQQVLSAEAVAENKSVPTVTQQQEPVAKATPENVKADNENTDNENADVITEESEEESEEEVKVKKTKRIRIKEQRVDENGDIYFVEVIKVVDVDDERYKDFKDIDEEKDKDTDAGVNDEEKDSVNENTNADPVLPPLPSNPPSTEETVPPANNPVDKPEEPNPENPGPSDQIVQPIPPEAVPPDQMPEITLPEVTDPTVNPTDPTVPPENNVPAPPPVNPSLPLLPEVDVPKPDKPIVGPVKQWKGVPKDSKRYELKKAAESMLGWSYSQPYRMSNGFRDCSSFVHTSIAKAGFTPYPAWAWTTYTMPHFSNVVEQIPWSDLRPGDIVLGQDLGHVAFYWGNDNQGNKRTLECCWGYGVCYGYINANGWNYPYQTAWRIKGIDGKNDSFDPNADYNAPFINPDNTPVFGTGNYNSCINYDGSTATLSTATISNEVAKTASSNAVNTEGVVYRDPNAINVTPEKLEGKQIELSDLNKNKESTLKMYLYNDLNEYDNSVLVTLSPDERISYLLEKIALYKSPEMALFLSDYLKTDFDKAECVLNKEEKLSKKEIFSSVKESLILTKEEEKTLKAI